MPLEITPDSFESTYKTNAFKFIHAFIAAANKAQQLHLKPPYEVERTDSDIYHLPDPELDTLMGIKFMFHFDRLVFVKMMPIFQNSTKTLQPNEFAVFFQKDQTPCEFSQVPNNKSLRNIITELDYETFWGDYIATYWTNIINELNNLVIMAELTQPYDSKFEPSKFMKNKPAFCQTIAAKGNITFYYPMIINAVSSQDCDCYKIVSGTKD